MKNRLKIFPLCSDTPPEYIRRMTSVASRQEKIGSLIFGLALGLALMVGFLSTSQNLFGYLCHFLGRTPGKLGQDLSFPFLAAFFYVSLPRSRPKVTEKVILQCVELSILPLLVSWIFGFFRPHPGLRACFSSTALSQSCLWYLVLAPVGEEFLFRGWFYGLIERIWPDRMLTATNPLPVALWVSSLGFSLWHLQNLGQDAWGFVLFQVAYTFFTGLWLGYLRYQTGTVVVPLGAHLLLNTATNL
jgi:membrane protease YdiL (CAAX protease family)